MLMSACKVGGRVLLNFADKRKRRVYNRDKYAYILQHLCGTFYKVCIDTGRVSLFMGLQMQGLTSFA